MASLTNNERVGRDLERLMPTLALYVTRKFKELFGNMDLVKAQRFLKTRKREVNRPIAEWDKSWLLILMARSWKRVFRGDVEFILVRHLSETRVRWAHPRLGHFSEEEADRVRESVDRLLLAISPRPGPRVGQMIEEQVEEERLDPSWPDLLPELLPIDWSGEHMGAITNGGCFRGVIHVGPSSSQPGEWAEGVSLYLLPPDLPYRESPDSPAAARAKEVLGSMQYPNSAMFLALGHEYLSELEELILAYRARKEVLWRERELEPEEIEGTQAQMEEIRRKVENQLRAGYCWVLVPSQSSHPDYVEWNTIRIKPSQNPVEHAWEVVEKAGLVVKTLSPAGLVAELERLPLWQSEHRVKVDQLGPEFARRLSSPRLENWRVIDRAIAHGFKIPRWEGFGFALKCDDTKGYGGLDLRGEREMPIAGFLNHRIGYLVRSQFARV